MDLLTDEQDELGENEASHSNHLLAKLTVSQDNIFYVFLENFSIC